MSSRRTGYAIVICLILASALAFARAEQLKLERSPVTAVRITRHLSTACRRGPNCPHSVPLRFQLRQPAVVVLTLVDSSGHTVRTFTPAGGRSYPKGRVRVYWNGRDQNGGKAPDGDYRLRVAMLNLGRTITIPNAVVLDTMPPKLTLVSPPGATPVKYRVNEPAHVYLAIKPDGGGPTHVLRGRHGRVRIPVAFRHQPATLVMVAIDQAGNSSGVVPAGRLS